MQRTIQLPEEQVQALERLAADEHQSVDDLVQRVVGDYLGRRQRERSDWGRRFDAFVAEVRSRVPPDVTPDEIEAEITANWEEYRAERSARAASAPADAGGH